MWTAEMVLVCALMLLARGADSLPPIVLLDYRPAEVSINAEGFVRRGEPTIYLLTDTEAFASARRSPSRCGPIQSLRRVASVVIHEEWHVRNPGDEPGAYTAQLSALVRVGAGPGNPIFSDVSRARQMALGRRQRLQLAASILPP